MFDLKTKYLGLDLKNPLVVSASPFTKSVDDVSRIEEAGAAAIVMHSLFEEQIIQDSLKFDRDLDRGAESFAESLSYFPQTGLYSVGPDKYLEQLSRLKKSTNMPIIGSLNGVTSGGWVEYAKRIQDAGADALELNLYYLETNPEINALELENRYLALAQTIRASLTIPLAVKISPFFSSLPNFVRKLAGFGVDGVVLFNRFYQPDFDLDNLEVVPNLVLSNSNELRLPIRWIAILFGKVKVDFALTSGVHSAEDGLKAIMAGANVFMMTSELLRGGINRISEILNDLVNWAETNEYESISQMRGSMSQKSVDDPSAFERANYIKVLGSY